MQLTSNIPTTAHKQQALLILIFNYNVLLNNMLALPHYVNVHFCTSSYETGWQVSPFDILSVKWEVTLASINP